MTKRLRIATWALIGALGVGLLAPTAAEAGSRGRRNTAIALGAVGLYGVIKKKPLIAGLGLGGAAYSYISSRNARKRELRRERRRRYYGGRRRYYPASYRGRRVYSRSYRRCY